MIARGFRPIGWVACVGVAAVGCYMVSLRVASERADLTGLERRIVQTRQQIRSLEAELGTRGRLQQLEQWNEEVLALSAPVTGQFIAPDARLAGYGITPPAPVDGNAEVQMAAATAPAPAQPVAVAPQRAVAPRPAAPQPALQQPMVQRASLTLPPSAAARSQPPAPRPRTTSAEIRTPARAAAPEPVRTASAEPRTATPARAETQPPASPSRRPLIDERTLRDITTTSRDERRGTRRN